MQKNKYQGMTVNERLYISGLFEEYEKAVEQKNASTVKHILEQLELTDLSIMSIMEQLFNQSKYP